MRPVPLHLATLTMPPAGATEDQSSTVLFSGSQLAGSRWDDRNEARPGTARAARPDEKRLRALGYTVHGIGRLKVLNTLTDQAPDLPLGEQVVGPGGYDVVCSGTFIYDVRSREVRVPAGPVMRRGHLEWRGVEKGQRRGAVAVLADGTIRMARTGGSTGTVTALTLQAAFGSPDNPVVELCGGGALLVERGARVANQDLFEVQRFESGSGGFRAPQMRHGMHIALGICDGTTWLVVAHSHNGQTIQDDLHSAGFGSLILFDGGSGGFVRDAHGTPYVGRELQGFGIHLRF